MAHSVRPGHADSNGSVQLQDGRWTLRGSAFHTRQGRIFPFFKRKKGLAYLEVKSASFVDIKLPLLEGASVQAGQALSRD